MRAKMNEATSPQLTAADLVDRLTAEFGYGPNAARQIATDLLQADPRVRQAFLRWWTTGNIDTSLSVEGYTIERLLAEKKRRHLSPLLQTLHSLRATPKRPCKLLDGASASQDFAPSPAREHSPPI